MVTRKKRTIKKTQGSEKKEQRQKKPLGLLHNTDELKIRQ